MMQGDGLGFEAMGVKEDEGEPTVLDGTQFMLRLTTNRNKT